MIARPIQFRGTALSLVFLVLLSSCSYRRPIRISPQQSGPPEGLSERDLGRSVAVVLADGTRLEGTLDAIDTRGIRLLGKDADTTNDILYEQVQRIDVLTRDYPGIFVVVVASAAVVLLAVTLMVGWGNASWGN